MPQGILWLWLLGFVAIWNSATAQNNRCDNHIFQSAKQGTILFPLRNHFDSGSAKEGHSCKWTIAADNEQQVAIEINPNVRWQLNAFEQDLNSLCGNVSLNISTEAGVVLRQYCGSVSAPSEIFMRKKLVITFESSDEEHADFNLAFRYLTNADLAVIDNSTRDINNEGREGFRRFGDSAGSIQLDTDAGISKTPSQWSIVFGTLNVLFTSLSVITCGDIFFPRAISNRDSHNSVAILSKNMTILREFKGPGYQPDQRLCNGSVRIKFSPYVSSQKHRFLLEYELYTAFPYGDDIIHRIQPAAKQGCDASRFDSSDWGFIKYPRPGGGISPWHQGSCQWRIEPPDHDTTIELSFDGPIVIEQGSACGFNSLSLLSEDGNLLRRYCGSSVSPPSETFNGRVLIVEFEFKIQFQIYTKRHQPSPAVEKQFNLTFVYKKASVAISPKTRHCDGYRLFESSSGVINFRQVDSTGSSCRWNIITSNSTATSISTSFVMFGESSSISLLGPDGTLLTDYTGKTDQTQNSFNLTGLTVVFESPGTDAIAGFNLTYNILTKNDIIDPDDIPVENPFGLPGWHGGHIQWGPPGFGPGLSPYQPNYTQPPPYHCSERDQCMIYGTEAHKSIGGVDDTTTTPGIRISILGWNANAYPWWTIATLWSMKLENGTLREDLPIATQRIEAYSLHSVQQDQLRMPQPGMYSVGIHVKDGSGGLTCARQLTLFDDSQRPIGVDSSKFFALSGEEDTGFTWHGTNASDGQFVSIQLSWKDAFITNQSLWEEWLAPVQPILCNGIPVVRVYDDFTGKRTIAAVPHIGGIVKFKFDATIVEDEGAQFEDDLRQGRLPFRELPTLTDTITRQVKAVDGQTYMAALQAEDIFGRNVTLISRTYISRSPPKVSDLKLDSVQMQRQDGADYTCVVRASFSAVDRWSGVKSIYAEVSMSADNQTREKVHGVSGDDLSLQANDCIPGSSTCYCTETKSHAYRKLGCFSTRAELVLNFPYRSNVLASLLLRVRVYNFGGLYSESEKQIPTTVMLSSLQSQGDGQPKSDKTGFLVVLVLFCCIVAVAIGGLVIYFYKRRTTPTPFSARAEYKRYTTNLPEDAEIILVEPTESHRSSCASLVTQ